MPGPAVSPRTFAETLNALRFGTLSDELTDKLRDLTAACAVGGRSGSLTLVLTLKPGNGGQMEVFDDIKMKMPKEQRGSSIMFATPDNNLTREDPRQHSLPLAEVRSITDPSTGEIRSLSSAPAAVKG